MEQKNNEDKDISGFSSSTSLSSSTSSTLIQDITKNKNIFLISKNFESKIPDILSYLQNDANLATNKIIILEYIKLLFINVEFNSEIFIRKFSNGKEKLNLYQIIINQYIYYTNPENSKNDEETYRSELLDLFILLLSQITMEREIYHYILSFLFNYNKEKTLNKNNNINNAEYLSRILELLQNFYKYIQSYNEPSNFFFFSGESDSSITITNIEHPKDPNKKLLNFDENLCIMLFVKTISSDIIKSVYPKITFKLFKMCFNEKNKKVNNNNNINNIFIDIDIDNNLFTNFSKEPLVKLPDDQMSCILVKFKKKKKLLIEIFINNKKFLVETQNSYKNEEIKEINLFKNFMGYCSNIIIYKEKKVEGLPKFLLCSDEESKIRATIKNSSKDTRKKSTKSIKSLFYIKCFYPFGFYNEEEYSNLIKIEIKNQIDENQYNELFSLSNEKKNIINEKETSDFLNNNLIAIYMPTRIEFPSNNDEKNISNAHQIILRDCVNNLNAEFNIKTPALNGVHIYNRITDDFKIIGGINNLLPLIELMTIYDELLTHENFDKFFNLITFYVFSPQYEKALIKEKNSNFFFQLSYFLERIPDEFFDRQLEGNLKSISSFLITNNENDFYELNQQFHNYIIMNEKILFKFNFSEQKELLDQITEIIKSTDSNRKILEIDIISLIKILLYYDKNKHIQFCCKEHSQYFTGNYQIMEPELNDRIEPVMNLLENILENILTKKFDEKINIQLEKIFELLTFDLSPCLQKNILIVFTSIMQNHPETNYNGILNLEQLLNISLFIFKISVFDVKIYALNYILLIAKNEGKLNLDDMNKNIFINNNILPYHLFKENVDVLEELNKNDDIDSDDLDNTWIYVKKQEEEKKKEEKNENKDKIENEEKELKIDEKENCNKIVDNTENKEKKEIIENKEDNKNDQNEDKKENQENKNDNQNSNNDLKLNKFEKKDNNEKQEENSNQNNVEKSERQLNEKQPKKKKIKIEKSKTDIIIEEVILKNEENEEDKNNIINENDINYKIKNKSKSSPCLSIFPSIKESNDEEEKIDDDIQILKINETITKHKSEKNIRLSTISDEQLLNSLLESQKSCLKKSLTINNFKYKIISITENQKKINNCYNKNKLKDLASGLYSQLFKYFLDDICPDITFIYLIKLISKSDLSLIDSFLTRIINVKKNNEKKFNQILSNIDFLQFLIETGFQTYMIKNNYNNFISGFSIEFNDNDLNDEENMETLKEIFKNCNKLMKMVFKNNMYKIDYLLTWCRYFLELKNENNKFELAKNFINSFIYDFVSDEIKSISKNDVDVKNNPMLKNILYLFNFYFEFCTFHKMKYFDSFYDFSKNKNIYQKISTDFRYILLSKIVLKNYSIAKNNDDNILTQDELMQSITTKFIFYPLFNSLYSLFSPLWKGENKKDDDIFKNINNKKDIYLKELEFLFYSFEDTNKDLFCNKGTPLIILLYHSFCLILNMGGIIDEIKGHFENFRYFIMLIIISSATVSTITSRKKKWPNEEQYKKIQNIIEAGIFNFIFFLSDKIKNIKNELKNLNEDNIETIIPENQENIEYLNSLNVTYIKNLSFLLKLLNIIYRESKREEREKSNNFFNMFSFKKETEGIRKFGGYILIQKIYKECFFSNKFGKRNSVNVNAIGIDNNNEEDFIDNSIRTTLHIPNMPDLENYNKDFSRVNTTMNTDYPKSSMIKNNKNKNQKNFVKLKTEKSLNPKNLIEVVQKNYLDELCCDLNDEKNYKIIEKSINSFINDYKIEKFYNEHKNEYIKILFPFVKYMKNRQDMIKTLIPIYNYKQNINGYPRDLCVLPGYFQESSYDLILKKIIENKNGKLKEELEANQKEKQMLEYSKYQLYKKTKKKLFSFTGIWSNEEYFYDIDKYRLKYKLFNHMTEDYTRILLTPILDIDYYLPIFSKFKGNLFRNLETLIPIYKIINLNLYKQNNINEKNDKINNINNNTNNIINTNININTNTINNINNINNDINSENNINTNNINIINENNNNINDIKYPNDNSFDSLNNSQNSKNNEEITNPLYDLFKENYSFIKNSINNPQKDLKLFNNYIKKKHFIDQKDEYFLLINDCCFIKTQYHIGGSIYINEKELGFYSYEIKRKGDEEDYDSARKTCFGSTFKQQTEKYIGYYLRIPWNEINFILKRRYYFKKTALEIYSLNKKSYLFRIPENKFQKLYENIRHYLKNDIEDILIEYDKTDEKIGFYSKKNIITDSLYFGKKGMNLKTLYEKWTKWEISTLKIIMILNIYANRSYNDINQYPVFPWIITDYTNNKLPQLDTKNFIRPFYKPMGMLDLNPESLDRKEDYENHWRAGELDPDKDDNYDRYCSHYSTAFYLTYYLVRIFPFSYIRIELQGKNFDDPSRLFNSVISSWEGASTQKTDLRELIPEFFCFPEMFYNYNELNLGEIIIKKKKILVEDIEMPNWVNDGYNFIMKHRELLESTEISEKINEWFNIIFGSKQEGKNAKKIGNLFVKQSYESYDEEYLKLDDENKNYCKHMVEFGVTPNRIFKNDTAKRKSCKEVQKKNCLLFNFSIKIGKNDDVCVNNNNCLKIDETDFYVEGNPYKIFIFMHKKLYSRNEKVYFLSKDKINIFSKTNEGKIQKEKINNEKEKNKKKTNIENDKENIKENESDENEEEKENEDIKEIEDNNKEIISKNEKNLVLSKYRINHIEAPTIIYDKGNYIALGGFYNGQIIINKIEDIELSKKNKNKPYIKIYDTNQFYPINNMIMDNLESFVICTNTKGVIHIYNINQNNKSEWTIYKILYDHENEISTIDINENLNIFIVCHIDGYCMLYSLPNCKLFNSFKLNENNITNNNLSILNSSTGNNYFFNFYANKVIISHCPLPCVVFYIKSRKSLIVYSINLHFMKEIFLDYYIVANGIKKYSDFLCRDYLFIYNCINQTIDVYDLPDLNIVTRTLKINYIFIDFHFSKELDHALILVKNQEKTEDDKRKKIFKILVLKASGDNNELF